MKIQSRVFGEIDIDDEKVVTFEDGIIGFPDLKRFALLFDNEKKRNISWLQSLDEPLFAMPVMNPLAVREEYNPTVEEELLRSLGNLTPDNMLVLVTVTVPQDLEKISVNFKAPIVINSDEKKAAQVIVEGEQVRFPIYGILKADKNEADKKEAGE